MPLPNLVGWPNRGTAPLCSGLLAVGCGVRDPAVACLQTLRVMTTFVLVHGAWVGGWSWSLVQEALGRDGFESYAPDLPGRGTSSQPLGDLYADARHLAEFVESLDREVVLVGHSYGGAVMSEAAISLTKVTHLVFVTGFCLEEGEAFLPLRRSITSDSRMADATVRPKDGPTVVVDPKGAVDVLFNEVPNALAVEAAGRLDPQLAKTFSQPVSGAPWRHLPSTYIRCSRDVAIPLALQDVMAARCQTVETLEADHSPFLSAVPGLVAAIERAVNR